jgi:hypothetical protein
MTQPSHRTVRARARHTPRTNRLTLALAPLLLLPAADEGFRYQPAAGDQAAWALELQFDLRCESFTGTVDGEELPEDQLPNLLRPAQLTLDLPLSWSFKESGFEELEGHLLAFERQLGPLSIGPLSIDTLGPLSNGQRIAFRRGSQRDEFSARLLSEEGEDLGTPELLGLFAPRPMAAWLDAGLAVAPGSVSKLELDADGALGLLLPGFSLRALSSLGADLALVPLAAAFLNDLASQWESCLESGSVTWTAASEEPEAGQQDGDLTGELVLHLDLSETLERLAKETLEEGQTAQDIVGQLRLEVDLEGAASLDLRRRLPTDFDLELPTRIELAVTAVVVESGQGYPVSARWVLGGEMRLTGTVE